MWGNARGWTISAVVIVLWAITVAGFGHSGRGVSAGRVWR